MITPVAFYFFDTIAVEDLSCYNYTLAAGNLKDTTKWSKGRLPTGGDRILIRHIMIVTGSTSISIATSVRIIIDSGGGLTDNGSASNLSGFALSTVYNNVVQIYGTGFISMTGLAAANSNHYLIRGSFNFGSVTNFATGIITGDFYSDDSHQPTSLTASVISMTAGKTFSSLPGCPSTLSFCHIATTTAGSIKVTSNWSKGRLPTGGDTIVIRHPMTVPGSSPLNINSPVRIIIENGGSIETTTATDAGFSLNSVNNNVIQIYGTGSIKQLHATSSYAIRSRFNNTAIYYQYNSPITITGDFYSDDSHIPGFTGSTTNYVTSMTSGLTYSTTPGC